MEAIIDTTQLHFLRVLYPYGLLMPSRADVISDNGRNIAHITDRCRRAMKHGSPFHSD
jgi:hypothetical protein